MKLLRIILLLLMPLASMAQNLEITGKVISADNKAPVAGASVFLSNSSFGTSTGTDGTFILNKLSPGQYNLIVTTVGYENSTQMLLVGDKSANLNIELTPKSTQLKEVTISGLTKSDKKKALAQFEQDFIGTDANASDCKITNPEVLNFSYSENKTVLEVTADRFLVIENKALGYNIKFLLHSFRSELLTGNVAYSGNQVFEELQGGSSKQKKWHQKRDEAYYGSAMHFYRSVYKDSLDEAGFKIYRLYREVNPNRPADSEIQHNIDESKKSKIEDYLYWSEVAHLSRYYRQKFKGKFELKDIVRQTERPGLKALVFPDHLYIVYTKRWESNFYKDVYRLKTDLNYQTTIISLINDNPAVVIDRNGTLIGNSPLYEGTWSQARLSVLLPVDYVPYNKPPE